MGRSGISQVDIVINLNFKKGKDPTGLVLAVPAQND